MRPAEAVFIVVGCSGSDALRPRLGLSAVAGGRASGYALGTVLFGCVPVVCGWWRRAGPGAIELLGGLPLIRWEPPAVLLR